MTIRWNDILAQRSARSRALSAAPDPVPVAAVLNESVSNINVTGATIDPQWRVEGVISVNADATTGVVPVPDAPIRFPARVRTPEFPLRFKFLNETLDQPIIVPLGLTLEPNTLEFVGNYPLLQSDTQCFTNPNSKPLSGERFLGVGTETAFNITTPLENTSYIAGTPVYGVEIANQSGVRWSGTILGDGRAEGTLEITINSIDGSLSEDDTNTQEWYISNSLEVIEQL